MGQRFPRDPASARYYATSAPWRYARHQRFGRAGAQTRGNTRATHVGGRAAGAGQRRRRQRRTANRWPRPPRTVTPTGTTRQAAAVLLGAEAPNCIRATRPAPPSSTAGLLAARDCLQTARRHAEDANRIRGAAGDCSPKGDLRTVPTADGQAVGCSASPGRGRGTTQCSGRADALTTRTVGVRPDRPAGS